MFWLVSQTLFSLEEVQYPGHAALHLLNVVKIRGLASLGYDGQEVKYWSRDSQEILMTMEYKQCILVGSPSPSVELLVKSQSYAFWGR